MKNALSPQSGQHPSTVFTSSPFSFLVLPSLWRSYALFLSSTLWSGCGWRPGRRLPPLRPPLAGNVHRGWISNKRKNREHITVVHSGRGHWSVIGHPHTLHSHPHTRAWRPFRDSRPLNVHVFRLDRNWITQRKPTGGRANIERSQIELATFFYELTVLTPLCRLAGLLLVCLSKGINQN